MAPSSWKNMVSANWQGGQRSWLGFECFMQECAGAGDLPCVLWGKAENLLVWDLVFQAAAKPHGERMPRERAACPTFPDPNLCLSQWRTRMPHKMLTVKLLC